MLRVHPTKRRAATGLVLALLLVLGGLASCSGTPDDSAAVDDGAVPRPLVTSTAYVATTLRVNYHTDVIVFMSPTSSGDQLREVTTAIQGMGVRSALLITSERAYDEARCLLAGRTNVLDTLAPELVGSQFRLDFGGDQSQIVAARLQLQNLPGVAQVAGGEDITGTAVGPAGAATPSSPTTTALPADAPTAPSCQAEGIRIN
jgi:hypothetical protein